MQSISAHLSEMGRMTSTEDAEHFQGLSAYSYSKIFQAVVYDTKNHVCQLVVSDSVGKESEDTWLLIFQALKLLLGFVAKRRTTIVDQEKSIDKAFKSTMSNDNRVLDWMHVRKNVPSAIVAEKIK